MLRGKDPKFVAIDLALAANFRMSGPEPRGQSLGLLGERGLKTSSIATPFKFGLDEMHVRGATWRTVPA